MKKFVLLALFVAGGLSFALPLAAQDVGPPGAAPAGGRGGRGGAGGAGGGGRGAPAYPAPVTDPAAVARGKTLYTDNNCASCHAIDIRGSDRGPSLLRSQLVQRDRKGELISPIIHTGSTGMPATASLTDAQIGDIAEFLHSIPINSRDPARIRPATIVTGDANSGQTYFQSNCGSCHSATGDLRGLATKYADPRTLQGRFLSPTSTQTTSVTVTLAGGKPAEGRLVRIDEFIVTLEQADGTQRTIARRGNVPKVEIHDPLAAHKALLRRYSDQNIHDLTAYLVTLK